ncbi:hypothetical protein MET9862_00189 [Methylobacterium symbioticum]|jgi:hypothetical protein|uniref:Uncharacterized protein n=1 Tax=Methylobacterium symbioticum TaxID=2584084 RepID=A0A509E7K5_9HYPH|nr:hypothetical protein MET9862_00189 [Methylobacterium symbioticum]
MARIPNTGRAASVSPEDFNERVKRLLADKPAPLNAKEPRKAAPRGVKPDPKR